MYMFFFIACRDGKLLKKMPNKYKKSKIMMKKRLINARQKQPFREWNLDYLDHNVRSLYISSTFDSFDVKEHFYTLLTSRDSCHNCQNSLTSDIKV